MEQACYLAAQLPNYCQTYVTRAGTPRRQSKLHKIMRLSYQINISNKECSDLTIRWLTTCISKPQTFIHQLLPTVERVNPPKSKFFGTMTCSKTGFTESVTHLTSAARHGVISGSPHLSSICGGSRCLFIHWGRTCISTRNHFQESPFQLPLKVASRYSFQWW
jgi:hypothetical protein